MLSVGIIAGHSTQGAAERVWEHERCKAATASLATLLTTAGYTCLTVSSDIYSLDNDAALIEKIRFLNERRVDLALELHLNAGGGDYSTCSLLG